MHIDNIPIVENRHLSGLDNFLPLTKVRHVSWCCPLWVQQAPSPSPCLLHTGCCGQREVVNSWRILSPHGHSIQTEWIFIENKGISSTSQNLRSEQHLCSGEGIKDRCRIQLQTGSFGTIWWNSWKRIRPHYHNAVYITASDMRFTSNCCIRWMSEDNTVCKIV